ncbi:MAG: EamA family transporter [Candidatus Micrarchaeaceae archaeon]
MIIYLVIFITLIAALIASAAQLAFKTSMDEPLKNVGSFARLVKKPKIIAGLLGYLLSLVIYLYALKSAPLSLVYPTFASTFIFVFALSAVFLGERPTLTRAAGITLVFFGIILIALSA